MPAIQHGFVQVYVRCLSRPFGQCEMRGTSSCSWVQTNSIPTSQALQVCVLSSLTNTPGELLEDIRNLCLCEFESLFRCQIATTLGQNGFWAPILFRGGVIKNCP